MLTLIVDVIAQPAWAGDISYQFGVTETGET